MELKQYNKELLKMDELKNNNGDTIAKIQKKLQNNNIKIGLYNDIINIVVETWNKYAGKKAGEKTREKIAKEIENTFNNNIFVYITGGEYVSEQNIYITTKDETGNYTGNTKIRIYTRTLQNRLINRDNTINNINIEDLKEADANTYTADTLATAQKIVELHEHAKKLQDELNEIHKEIGIISNYSIECVKYTNSVNWWTL